MQLVESVCMIEPLVMIVAQVGVIVYAADINDDVTRC